MASEIEGQARSWKTAQVYSMAGICLVVGLALGYLFRGSASGPAPSPQPEAAAAGASAGAPAKMPSLADMKHMADKQAEPVLAKLKTAPRNSDLLNQLGTIYKATH